MRQAALWLTALMTAKLLISAAMPVSLAQDQGAAMSAGQPGSDLATGWTLVKEGEAEGSIEQDAKHPANLSQHLLRIAITKAATPGKGRAGAINSTSLDIHEGQSCDVSFSAVTERGSIGLVFSLEGSDGKVLARTTLPEIGRDGRGRGAGGTEPAAAWRKYTVSLHPRTSDPNAHLVITPIEPTNIWLDGITLTGRAANKQSLEK